MKPTNTKLRDRAVRMVAALTDTDYPTAETAFAEADGTIKLATVMLLKSLDRQAAESLLANAAGNLRTALSL
jgi:N-acetylmuramic acid 6-phosphate etherase